MAIHESMSHAPAPSGILPVPGSMGRLAILESDPNMREYFEKCLGNKYELSLLEDQTAMFVRLEQSSTPHMIIVAWHSRAESIPLLLKIQDLVPRVPVLLLSYAAEMESLMAYSQLGICGVVLKPFLGTELATAIEQYRVRSGDGSQKDEPMEIPLNDTHSFVRCSKRMREIECQARVVARADIPVLILGESGTGKEIIARYTHLMSTRRDQTFLKVNCAAMPADLIESELFGYEQGAFTGAMKAKQGKFEMCHRGTIFLDEIGEMPAMLQAKLLQVLQDGTFSRLGGRHATSVDVRVIAATNINMKEAIAQKRFREDLYYRLNGFTLHLPPLRERRDEIPVLADYFMRKAAKRYVQDPLFLSDRLMGVLVNYGWPGNLRELENVVNRYLVMGDERAILDELMPVANFSTSSAEAGLPLGASGLKNLVRNLKGEAESVAIADALEENGWNRKAAAGELKISYKALLYKIKQYNLEPQARAC